MVDNEGKTSPNPCTTKAQGNNQNVDCRLRWHRGEARVCWPQQHNNNNKRCVSQITPLLYKFVFPLPDISIFFKKNDELPTTRRRKKQSVILCKPTYAICRFFFSFHSYAAEQSVNWVPFYDLFIIMFKNKLFKCAKKEVGSCCCTNWRHQASSICQMLKRKRSGPQKSGKAQPDPGVSGMNMVEHRRCNTNGPKGRGPSPGRDLRYDRLKNFLLLRKKGSAHIRVSGGCRPPPGTTGRTSRRRAVNQCRPC